jgi:membrane-associated phospholipid phosphatase
VNDAVFWRKPWVSMVPAVAAALLIGVLAADANRHWFGVINAWSAQTGATPWPYVTILGDTAVALALMAPLVFRRPGLAWALAIGAVAATAFVHVGKPIFSAPRPPGVLVPPDIIVIGPAYSAHSFPSGHTTTIFLAAGLCALHLANPALRTLVIAVAIVVGLSRIVVGVHWPVDVLAGAIGGWLSAVLGVAVAQRWPAGAGPRAHLVWIVVTLGCAVALLAGLKTGYPQAAPLQYAIGAGALLITLALWLRQRAESGTDPSAKDRQ